MSAQVNEAYSSSVLSVVRDLAAADLSVIPIRPDGSKAPALTRGNEVLNRKRRATDQELQAWFGTGKKGIGILSGAISANLELIDFDRDAETLFPDWCALVEAEVPGLVPRLSVTRTPRPGFHVRYRCPEVPIPGNLKLATDPKAPRGDQVLIETRGEGGYALAPGSPAECHETGRPYIHHAGPPLTQLQVLTASERDLLIRAARSFDRSPPDSEAGPALGGGGNGELLPGEDFNRHGHDWQDILGPHGWGEARRVGTARYWRRPDKDNGWSATTGVCTSRRGWELFYCFRSNGEPFEAGKCYSKFTAYTLLNHRGDFSAAARDLARQRYGEPARQGQTRLTAGPSLLTYDANLESKSVDYLVPGILARGMLSVLYGERDCNKSTWALLTAVRLSRQRKTVIFFSAEENWQEGLLPKLRGMGADFDFLKVLTGKMKAQDDEYFFELDQAGIAALRQTITETGAVLVVFDPIASVLPDQLRANQQAHVRRLLFILKELAESAGTAILGIAHVNKDVDQNPRDRMSGSASWTDAPRFVYLMLRDPDDRASRRRYLVTNKANPLPDEDRGATLWEVRSIPALNKDGSQLHDSRGQPLTVPTLEFVRATAETIESLCDPNRQKKKAAQATQEGRQRQLAKAFLRGALGWGPRPAPELQAHAEAAGIPKPTLDRAKHDLAVACTPPSKATGKHWLWSLPSTGPG
jgi:KaiC/GvpD/RAD55 family RecA-like ATPase